jgi:small subunit ribosomal protein S17
MSTATSDSRNKRKTIIGFVTSRSGAKSIKVTIPYKTPHPLYHKVINRKTVVHAHDEANATKVGDKVEIMETRPISRLKRWRVVSILHSAVVDHRGGCRRNRSHQDHEGERLGSRPHGLRPRASKKPINPGTP